MDNLQNDNMYEEVNVFELVSEDGTESEYEHLDTVEFKDDKYVVCVPLTDEPEEAEEIFIFKIVGDENDGHLEIVTNDDVLEDVYELFKERNLEMFTFEE